MIKAGDVISYLTMCQEEGVNLQRGMNFRLKGKMGVILMSVRKGAPYADKIEDKGEILIYEGHDEPKYKGSNIDPKNIDQPMHTPKKQLTQNGLFYQAAAEYKTNKKQPELIKVYEKLRDGIWTYNGIFELLDAWIEKNNKRNVFKFKLHIASKNSKAAACMDIEHTRIIPTSVKLEVWARDKGKCVQCGAKDNLHFDHIIPYSKGGSSLVAENIQLLCVRHNIAKKDKIE